MESQDIRQFYAACDAAHREFFSTLIHEWTQAGLPWSEEERGVALCARTAMRDNPVLFVLESGAGGRKEAISLRLDVWHEALGHADADRFLNALKSMDGLKYQERDGEIVMTEPGHASGPVQHEVRRRIQTLALRLRDLIGR